MSLLLDYTDKFVRRHIGPSLEDQEKMCREIGVSSVNELINQTIPSSIRLKNALDLPEAISEYEFLKQFKVLAQKNKIFRTYIGTGYYGTITPTVIRRNILENPGWYTAYTPYQAEIAQGRLEALLNYQTMVCDLTGMEMANASLLDEGTAAGEAMTLLYSLRKGTKKNANKFFVADTTHPQTIDVLKTRAYPIGIELVIAPIEKLHQSESLFGQEYFGLFIQYPDTFGKIEDYEAIVSQAHQQDILVAFGADLLSLTILKSPGEMGADVVVGSAQRFGVPMGYGGPHAAFFATREAYKRSIPGRIIGVSVDVDGNKAYRMSLQTREQHIKREKATSNICTSQVLLAVISGMYAVYHGPQGLRNIGQRVHDLTRVLASILTDLGFEIETQTYFDTIKVKVKDVELIKSIAENKEINFRYFENAVGISIDQTVSKTDLLDIAQVFLQAINKKKNYVLEAIEVEDIIPASLKRNSSYLTHKVFNSCHSEHEMLRYIKKLENKDISLTHSMISLGSCTMKLNATTEMLPITWEEFANIHPFVPLEQAKGYQQLFKELNKWLCEITGFAGVSLQPNSGAQGEYAGLIVIRAYQKARGEGHRNVVLIPSSAHGTNPASAVMVGLKVVVVACDANGNIDVEDLKAKADLHAENLSCLMVTYPSTHGVFEESIIAVCQYIHEKGGQVYMDGANMNAQVGLTSPNAIGADVCHLNLHKTFCIPHGGGGPGVGPIAVAEHLVPFLPGHSVVPIGGKEATHAVSSAPWGSAGILPIPYAYMKLMGGEGLKNATEIAILNANYLLAKLKNHYQILYTGSNGRCAHELIVDFREFKQYGIEVEDVAKRLMDYGFHAPTVSFPVAGTLMIEPTESESFDELAKFIDAMLKIREEIALVCDGKFDKENNVLKKSPHIQLVIMSDDWSRPYSKLDAAYPLPYLKESKIWPTVSRIDNAYGDRNLVCTCEPIESYE